MRRREEGTAHPARLARNKHAPAASCGDPMRPRGLASTIASPKFLNVAAIILLGKGPQAKVLLVIPRGPSSTAKVRERWCRPALEAL